MLTAEQKAVRATGLGASETAAALGLDPYKSPADLWLEKTGRATGFDGNEATDRGNFLEEPLIKFAEKYLDVTAQRGVQLRSKRHPEIIATLDAIVLEQHEVIEAKSTVVDDEWGDPGTDQVPKKVLIQVHQQMYCVGDESQIAWVPVIIPAYKRFEWRMYCVRRIPSLVDEAVEGALDFWNRYVKTDTRPDDYRPSMEFLKRVKRAPNKTTSIPVDLVRSWARARDIRLAAEKNEEEKKAALLASLDDAEAGEFDGGRVTFMESNRKGFVVEPTTYRTLRIKGQPAALPEPTVEQAKQLEAV